MAKILIVEDEEDLVAALAFNLEKEGHTVVHAARGDLALNATLREQPDLILLDLMLPGLNGRDVCRTLREKGIDVPIIMLTARSDELDRVVGLEIGADDYVTKPFSVRELLARINVRLRRAQAGSIGPPGQYRFGSVMWTSTPTRPRATGGRSISVPGSWNCCGCSCGIGARSSRAKGC